MQGRNQTGMSFWVNSARNSTHQNSAERLPYTGLISREPNCVGAQPGEPVKDAELYSIEQARKLLGGLSRNFALPNAPQWRAPERTHRVSPLHFSQRNH